MGLYCFQPLQSIQSEFCHAGIFQVELLTWERVKEILKGQGSRFLFWQSSNILRTSKSLTVTFFWGQKLMAWEWLARSRWPLEVIKQGLTHCWNGQSVVNLAELMTICWQHSFVKGQYKMKAKHAVWILWFCGPCALPWGSVGRSVRKYLLACPGVHSPHCWV